MIKKRVPADDSLLGSLIPVAGAAADPSDSVSTDSASATSASTTGTASVTSASTTGTTTTTAATSVSNS